MYHQNRYAHQTNRTSGQHRNAFTGAGMLSGSVAIGATMTVWNRAAKQPDMVKKCATVSIGSAAVGIANLLHNELVSHHRAD
jgi:hypothetical protein